LPHRAVMKRVDAVAAAQGMLLQPLRHQQL